MEDTERDQLLAMAKIRGVVSATEVGQAGIHSQTLTRLVGEGVLDRVSRGVYRLADLPPLAEPDLVTVALRVPRAVITLVSALRFHGLTTEIPHDISIALPKGTARPRLDWPPLRVHWFTSGVYEYGIEAHAVDGVAVRVYGPAKAVADAFRFRNQLGIGVAVEALRLGLEERRFTPADVMRAAKVCRVTGVVRPYLEALQ